MEIGNENRIRKIWKQDKIPVVFRKGKGFKLMVRIPYSKNNALWLKGKKRIYPVWNKKFKCWDIPKAWFNDLIDQILEKHRKLYIVQPYREQEVCAPACWNAVGHECECSCMGENHGSQGPNGNWMVISETFATRWHDRELACRLLSKSKLR